MGDVGVDFYFYIVNESLIFIIVLLEVEDFNVLYLYMIYERFLYLFLYGMLGVVIIILVLNFCLSFCLKIFMCRSLRNSIYYLGLRVVLLNKI